MDVCSRAYRIAHARAYVFSDSVLCVGKMGDDPIATWKSKIKWYSENNHFKDMNRIDCMPTEFEWKIFPGITTSGLLEKIRSLMRDLQCEPELFNDRIIFMSMYNDIVWQEKGNKEKCETNSQTVANYARKFTRGHWSFLGPGSEKKWYGTYTDKHDGSWDQTALKMMAHQSGHGDFCESAQCLRSRSRSMQRIVQMCNWSFGKMEIPTDLSIEGTQTSACPKTRKYPNCALMRVWSLSKEDNTSTLFVQKKGRKYNIFCREYTMPRNEKKTRARPSLGHKSLSSRRPVHYRSSNTISVSRQFHFLKWNREWCWQVRDRIDADQGRRGHSFGEPIAKTRPRQKPTVTLTSVSIPVRESTWTDIETQRSHDQNCFDVSNAVTRLQRHDRKQSIEECRKKKVEGASKRPFEEWISTLAKGVWAKKSIQYCLNPNSSDQFLYLRVIQGHSGKNATDLTLQDNVLLPEAFTEYIFHVGWIWKSWCRNVLHPVTDAFRLWLSGEHCRLGSWRWRTTKNASFTTVNAKSGRLWIILDGWTERTPNFGAAVRQIP